MSEHLLNVANISPVFEHESCHSMTENMAASLFADIGFFNVVSTKLSDVAFRYSFTANAQEKSCFVFVNQRSKAKSWSCCTAFKANEAPVTVILLAYSFLSMPPVTYCAVSQIANPASITKPHSLPLGSTPKCRAKYPPYNDIPSTYPSGLVDLKRI